MLKTIKTISKSRRFGLMLIMVAMMNVMSTALTSCDDDDDYYAPIVGTWQACDSPGSTYNEFTFYGDGTGLYSAYNMDGLWTTWTTQWDIDGSYLTIWVNETGQEWNYSWAIRGYYLYLNDGINQLVYELE